MELETIAIVGSSFLGRRVACLAAVAGYRTVLEDISPSALEQGIAWVTRTLDSEVFGGRITAAQRDAALANLTTASSAEEASRYADLIIEAVSDEIEMKIELFTIFDKFAKPGAIFASTTTKLSISELAAVTFSPGKCIGMRFLETAQDLEKLDLVNGRETSEETIAACLNAARRLGLDVSVDDEERAQL